MGTATALCCIYLHIVDSEVVSSGEVGEVGEGEECFGGEGSEEEEEEVEKEEKDEESEEVEQGLAMGGTGFREYAGRPLPLDELLPRPHISPSDQLAKYWSQRYRLFSRYDDGVCLDRGMMSPLRHVPSQDVLQRVGLVPLQRR